MQRAETLALFPLGRSLKLRPGGIVGSITGCAKEEFVQLVNSVIITLHAVKSGFQSERIRGPRLPAFAAVWCTTVHRLPQRLGALSGSGVCVLRTRPSRYG